MCYLCFLQFMFILDVRTETIRGIYMSFQCKIAVLGPTVRDHITTPNEEVIEKYGGVSNPCIALAKLLESSGSEIFPVTHVRKRDEQNILDLLRPFENITLDYISSDADQGDVIRLQFLDTNKRSEKMSAFMTPITPDDVKNLLFCDAFLMVPVTESEITLDTLKFIKDYSDSLTLFDAHGPTTLMTVLGDRLPKFWIDRDRWLPYIDILKMNMEEVKSCWFREKYKLSELESDYDFNSKELPDFAKHCIDMGVKAVCVTRDANGCSLYFEEDGEIKEHFKFELGSNMMLEDMETPLIGKQAGDEVNLSLEFPKDYHGVSVAGKKAEFHVIVHKVLEN